MGYNTGSGGLKADLKKGLSQLNSLSEIHSKDNLLKIDLHCHDYNSDKPDEILGRILNIPETWLPTDVLLKTLKKNSCDAFTITNHNNARSCWELKDQGHDILSGAEFSCTVPDFEVGIHVLTYGFTPSQEQKLKKYRYNIYKFQSYCLENNLPTVWAHPLYYYSKKGILPMEFFEKMALIFERFEVLNGQRDTWQNLLTYEWLRNLGEEDLFLLQKKHKIDSDNFIRNSNIKHFTGGSDSHMGIFAGSTASYLYVPGLSVRKFEESVSEMALDALLNGYVYPTGGYNSHEKMSVAFLDFISQNIIYHKDPGLMRILLHKGTDKEKFMAILATNALNEFKRHKTSLRFVKMFHKSLLGKSPAKSQRWFISSVYRPVFDELGNLASLHSKPTQEKKYIDSVYRINEGLNEVLSSRIKRKMNVFKNIENANDINNFFKQLELASEFRTWLDKGSKVNNKTITNFSFKKFLDGLSFPFLANNMILASNFMSTKVLYNSRPLLEKFSEITSAYVHPKRILWLTDSFEDSNGVSVVLNSIHKQIQIMKLPIDIVCVSDKLSNDNNLKVIKPAHKFKFPFYKDNDVKIPDFMELHKLFQQGEYDRIIVSTEGPMGLGALYLKYAFNVKAWFYMHTDWMIFARKVFKFDHASLSRLRRILRAYYKNFDGVFVLNTEHKKWLISKDMEIDESKIHLTSHWVDGSFKPVRVNKKQMFALDDNEFILLFSGRLSKEKGIGDAVFVYKRLKEKGVNVKFIIAGIGPEENEIKKEVPEAIFLGWLQKEELRNVYSASDLLILPSVFDTFSLSVLEAMSCGLPVLAYRKKGPADIIKHNENGLLCKSRNQMVETAEEFFSDEKFREHLKNNAIIRSLNYNAREIMSDLCEITGIKKDR